MLSPKEIRQLTPKDFESELKKTIKDLEKMRFSIMGGHSKASHELKNLKKYLARLLTLQK